MSVNGSSLLIIERILRDRQSIWRQIVDERDLGPLTVSMLASSVAALACYGAVLGAFHGVLMALTSAVKLPLLFLITLAICLPTLYLFNLVFGAKLSVRQALALVMVAITVTSMLAVAFAPISLFFLITAPDYGFFKLLNVGILTLSALVGLRFLTGGMQTLNEHGLLSANAQPTAAGVTTPAVTTPAVTTPAVTAPAVTAPAVTAPAAAPAVPVPALAGAVPATAGSAATVSAPVTATSTAPNGDNPTPEGAAPATPAPVPASAAPAGVPVQGQPVLGHPVAPLPGHGYVPPQRRGYQPPGQRPASMTLLYIWILLFGFVGTQLAWTLRPFFGSPGEEFALFRSIEGNFYAEIFRTIAHLG